MSSSLKTITFFNEDRSQSVSCPNYPELKLQDPYVKDLTPANRKTRELNWSKAYIKRHLEEVIGGNIQTEQLTLKPNQTRHGFVWQYQPSLEEIMGTDTLAHLIPIRHNKFRNAILDGSLKALVTKTVSPMPTTITPTPTQKDTVPAKAIPRKQEIQSTKQPHTPINQFTSVNKPLSSTTDKPDKKRNAEQSKLDLQEKPAKKANKDKGRRSTISVGNTVPLAVKKDAPISNPIPEHNTFAGAVGYLQNYAKEMEDRAKGKEELQVKLTKLEEEKKVWLEEKKALEKKIAVFEARITEMGDEISSLEGRALTEEQWKTWMTL